MARTSRRPNDRAPSQYFENDYGSRYPRMVPPLLPPGANNRQVEKSIRMNPEESLAAMVWNFDSMYTERIRSLVNRGRFAEAVAMFEEAHKVIDENESGLFSLIDLRGAGERSDELAGRTFRILNNPFSGVTAKFNGEEVPLDALLRDGGRIAMDAAKDEFASLGLSSEVSDAFFNGDDRMRATLRNLIQPLLTGDRKDYGQRVELAEDVVSNWDELYGLFGDGVTHFMARHQASHAGAGGASDSLRSLMAVARGINEAKGLSGKDLAREVLSAYDGLTARIFARDTDTRDAQGRPKEAPVSAVKRMTFDSTVAAAVQALTERGVAPDLRSSKFTKAVSEVMDAQAYASDCGIDLVGLGHDTGNSMKPAFGEYIADAVTETATTGANPVNAFRAYRQLLDNQITGGLDFASQIYRNTGNAEDYLVSLSRGNGGYSSSPGADAIAKGIKSYLIQKIAPGMIAGLSPDDALRSARTGAIHSGTDFLVGLSDNIRQHLYGKDSAGAADLIAASVSDALDRGQKFSVEDIVRDISFGEGSDDDPTDAVKSLRDWYWGNVTQANEYAQVGTQLRAHLLHDEELPDYVAASELGKAAQEAGRMRRLGRDGSEVYTARMKAGTVYVPMVDEATGSPMRDEVGNHVVERRVVSDRTQYGYDPNGDNSEFENSQRYLKAQYDLNVISAKTRASGLGRQSVDETA